MRVNGKTIDGVPETVPPERTQMKPGKFPQGWNEKRVRAVLACYEAAFEDTGQTFMEVPNALVPKVRELIAAHAQ